ncbi:hypothetical protein [Maridesulfovibrio frigidus]|uniref:hypothetical protein n=1 Tax=Maridesulfovibrio frigidus TaxID=340956 RepID=UPI0004E181AA|nr:hypothetical protein [Maridesulfovibrio frigidus]
MTVVSSSNNITFAGDGVQILFDFNFKIFREDDLAAVVRDSLGVEKQLVAGTDFKLISGPEIESGGRVSYPLSGDPLQVGESITLYRDIAYSQELELVDNDPFSAGLLNEAFDRGVMRDQQLQEQIARSLKYDISTPAEEQLMPQEFMNTVISSRDAANMAESGAAAAKAEAQVAQSAAEVARAGAEAAQVAAEYAKDQAEEIAWGELDSLRSDTPILAGPAVATEGETVEISITDYVEDSLINYEIDVAEFGSAQLVGSVISWTLGSVDIDTAHFINVIKRKRGEIYSETAVHQILVKDVLVNDGPTVVFSNDSSGWPGATIDDDGIHVPANSVGAINTQQIVSGEMEIEVASGEFPVLAGTTDKLLKSSSELIEGLMFFADTGSGYLGEVTATGDPIVYSAVIDLQEAPTKMFKNPLQGEIVNVSSGSSTTSFVSLDELIESQKFESNAGDFEAGVVAIDESSVVIPAKTAPLSYQYVSPIWMCGDLVKTGVTISHLNIYLQAGHVNTGAATANLFLCEKLSETSFKIVAKTPAALFGAGDNITPLESPFITEEGKEYVVGVGGSGAGGYISSAPSSAHDGVAGYTCSSTSVVVDATYTMAAWGTTTINASYSYEETLYTADITAAGLTEAPNYASRKVDNLFSLAAGAIGQVLTEPDHNLLPSSYSFDISGDNIKVNSDKVGMPENPDIKQIAMAVHGSDGLIFKNAKIYIQETVL